MVATDKTAFTGGHFGLTIDGSNVNAYIKSIEGGFIKANVTDESVGPDNLHVKHLATREIEPFSVEMGLSGSRNVLQWIQDSWKRRPARRNGQVTHADFNMHGRFDHHFREALITEVSFPTLGGEVKENSYLRVKFHPEVVETKTVKSGSIFGGGGGGQAKKSEFYNARFKVRLDGVIDNIEGRVGKVDAITFKQGVRPLFTGRALLPQIEPTKVEFPDVSLYITLAYAKPAMDWYEKIVVKGGKETSLEKTGAIEYCNPQGKTVFTIKMSQVGARNCTIVRSEGLQDQIKRVKLDLYVGQMELDYGSVA